MEIALRKFDEELHNLVCETIDFCDADADLMLAIKERSDSLYTIYVVDILVGIAQVEPGTRAYLYVYIDPKHRSKGYGSLAIKEAETLITTDKTELILSSYRVGNDISKVTANKLGFNRKFSSSFMEYSGKKFEIDELPIREYNDDDYDEAQKMHAIAFHNMRVSVGDFPESVVQSPSQSMREHWAKTKASRFVYLNGKEIVAYGDVEGNEIDSVSVKSEYQGLGIGKNFIKYLCNYLLKNHSNIGLYCVVGNTARSIYDSLGFEELYTAEYIVKKIK